ncbi:hypothetical protein ACCW76_15010 [Pantoea sp. C8B4]|uniref:hypothetical protein n=1 Tax=Pantoea sp. C8B4 TaxID=3243083 RepID=UPI003ED96E1B
MSLWTVSPLSITSVNTHCKMAANTFCIAVRVTLVSLEVKVRIALDEMFGYSDYTQRFTIKMGSLDPSESCAVTMDGQKIVLMDVPSNRTLETKIDDNTFITHPQELLDTDTERTFIAWNDRRLIAGHGRLKVETMRLLLWSMATDEWTTFTHQTTLA